MVTSSCAWRTDFGLWPAAPSSILRAERVRLRYVVSTPTGLTPQGNNLYTESKDSGAPIVVSPGKDGTGTILSGSLEISNVDIAEEVVGQITSQAAFTANAKVIRSVDEIIGTILDIKS